MKIKEQHICAIHIKMKTVKLEVWHLIENVVGDEGVAHLSDATVKSRYHLTLPRTI